MSHSPILSASDPAPSARRLLAALRGLNPFAAIERRLEAERDQIALWLPVALGAGIAAWMVLPDRFAWFAAMAGFAGLAFAGCAVGLGSRLGRMMAVGGAVALLGVVLIWTRADWVASPRIDRPTVAIVAGRVAAVERLPARDIVRVTVEDVAAPLPPRLRLNVDQAQVDDRLSVGDRIAVRARLMPPAPPPVPGAQDFARTAWFQRLGATGKALDPPIVTQGSEGGWLGWLADRRAALSRHIEGRLPGSEGGVAASLATGDQGAIAEEDAEALRRAGLAHLLSVSGLHVSAVVGGVMLLTLRLLALSPALALRAPLLLIAAGAGALAGIVYTLLSGAQVPTIRSCIAALLVLAGIAMGREAITLRLVATGALVVLLLWPEAIAGPSFQLSFAAVTALVALLDHPRIRAFAAPREEGWLVRRGRGLALLLLSGLAIEVALAPIALFHFHKSGLYGALANIVAIPLTTFLIMPAEALALLLDAVGFGAPFWWVTGQALSSLLWLARTVAEAPGAVTMLPTMGRLAFGLFITGGLWLALWRTGWRRWGLLPCGLGTLLALTAPAPDLLITGDGRHVAFVLGDGRVALLRERAGDYVRGMLGEAAGHDGEPLPVDALMQARCSTDLCVTEIARGGRRWRIAATRSPYRLDWVRFTRICTHADIVISDRRLPRACKARWLTVDRRLLARTGGIAIDLDRGGVATVAGEAGHHPWVRFDR